MVTAIGQKGLSASDLSALTARWITPEMAEAAGIYRVTAIDAAALFGKRPTADLAGLILPYRSPWDGSIRGFRLRRDVQPSFIHLSGSKDGAKPKYEQPWGQPNLAYFSPYTTAAEIDDADVWVVITEGEFKTLALDRLGRHEASTRHFFPIGIGGVWSWRGRVGKATGPNGSRVDEKGVIPDLRRIPWKGRRVVIAFDSDVPPKAGVEAARRCLSRELREAGAEVAFLEWDGTRGKGIDDWLANEGPEVVAEALSKLNFDRMTGWQAKLVRTEKDKIKICLLNGHIAVSHAPEWDGVLAYDQFRNKVRVVAVPPIPGDVPRDWTDADDIELALWLQRQGIGVGREVAGAVVQVEALKNPIHPLRDWLCSLTWDGTKRVGTWLHRYFGVEKSDYSYAVGEMWLISAVARVLQPGCKADHMMILEGPQGIGKSRGLRTLAGEEWFSDAVINMKGGDKDAQMLMSSAWIFEVGELESLRRSDVPELKGFISRTHEVFRPPYGHHLQEVPRQCVFCATTNERHYLQDASGNRRFWPVAVGVIDIDALARDREQIWAEAIVLYRQGKKWWPEGQFLIQRLTEQQADRLDTDPWQTRIEELVQGADWMTSDYLLQQLGIDLKYQTQQHKNRLSRCMAIAGFQWKRRRVGGWQHNERESGYERVSE